MRKNDMKWMIIDMIVGIISGIAGLFGIYTGIKSANAQQELSDLHIEQKYGLKAIDEED